MERKVTRHFVFFIQKDEFTRFVLIITGKYIVFKLQNYSELPTACFCLVLIEIFGRYNRPESDKELKVNYLLTARGKRKTVILGMEMQCCGGANVEANP